MLTGQDYSNRRSSLVRLADEILALELIWPFPLIGMGVLKILDPLMIGVAIVLALIPWLVRWLVFGRLTRHAFIGGALGLFVAGALIGEEGGRLARLARMTGSLMPNLVVFAPHPNAAAGFLEGPFLLSLALIWRTRGGRRLVWGLAAVVIAYGLLISGSRGSWAGLVVAMVIGALLLVPSRPLRLTGG
ncbi:MAG: hypothetical protein P8186_30890, partial [Anaerolineae bacterium]